MFGVERNVCNKFYFYLDKLDIKVLSICYSNFCWIPCPSYLSWKILFLILMLNQNLIFHDIFSISIERAACILSSDPLYVRAGPAIPQWNLPGLTSSYGPGLFLLPSSQFSSEARLLALEIYGHTAGQIKVFVSTDNW